MNKEIVFYTTKHGDITIQPLIQNDTIWMSQEDIGKLFWKGRTTITEHLGNIFKEEELIKTEVILKVGNSDNSVGKGKTLYNLDTIIAVGYRVNSKEATQFRIWATQILRDYITKWYALNHKRLQEKGYNEVEGAIQLVKKALESGDVSKDEALGLLDIVTSYTNTWLLLQKYDEDALTQEGKTKDTFYKLEAKEAEKALSELKKDLIAKTEATELFAHPKDTKALEGIFWNIYQTFWGSDLYPSLEEKAAHLLYFIIKDHPFTDGNKRSGAFLFILFLVKNNLLYESAWNRKINDRALVAITLLIAQSKPSEKELMTKLVVNLIN